MSDRHAAPAPARASAAGGVADRPFAVYQRDLAELDAACERLRLAIYSGDAAGTERAATEAVSSWLAARAAATRVARGATRVRPMLEALGFWIVECLFEKARARIASPPLHAQLDELGDYIDDVGDDA